MPNGSSCQEEVEITFLGNVFGLLEEVCWDDEIGVEDLDAGRDDRRSSRRR
jgi:hypothetical protein